MFLNWNVVIFVIVLVVAIVIVPQFTKSRTCWTLLLVALTLYFAVHWSTPSWGGWLRWVFWLLVAATVVVALATSKNRLADILAAATLGFALLGTLVTAVAADGGSFGGNSGAMVRGSSPSPSALPASCPEGFRVKLDPNKGAKLISKGVSPKNETMRKEVAQKAKEDPRVFFVYLQASPLASKYKFRDSMAIAPTKNGMCYKPAGIAAYKEWSVLWSVALLQDKPLPANGTNTGAKPKGTSFQQHGTIPKGKGVWVTYRDANGRVVGGHWVRRECGNVVTPGPIAGIPGKPPGAPDIVLNPKSGNAADYKYPEGKPPVGAPAGSAQGTPEQPRQNAPGGGGVNDNPTNHPGSEAGIPAPGASPNRPPPPPAESPAPPTESPAPPGDLCKGPNPPEDLC